MQLELQHLHMHTEHRMLFFAGASRCAVKFIECFGTENGGVHNVQMQMGCPLSTMRLDTIVQIGS